MDFLKSLFSDKSLSWDEFSNAVAEKGFKVADLSKGNYVARKKYDDDIASRDTTITDLTNQISTRDTDISNLQKALEDGGKDNETKISELTSQISQLQTNYDTAKTEYENRLAKQSYEFAVKEFAGNQKFSSNAARRDFINEMISAGLKMQNDMILGAGDFVEQYKAENTDAFVIDNPDPDPAPQDPKPFFVQPTPPTPDTKDNPFNELFNFGSVR